MLKISRAVGLAAIIAAATTSLAFAQPGQDSQAPGGTRSESGGTQQYMRGQNMPGQGMMGRGMMRDEQRQGRWDEMHMNRRMGPGARGMGRAAGMGRHMNRAPMMKMMFAIVDANGNGAVSFDEVMEIHKRMFDAIDANNNGSITPEEIESFFHD
jgi:hypothetical protein